MDGDGSIETLKHFPDPSNQLPAFATGLVARVGGM
jgi:hypothetical protein